MKKVTIILLLWALAMNGFAQDTTLVQTVRGTVVDEDVQLPLIGVLVSITFRDKKYTSTTNFEGVFKLENIPVGRQELLCSYFGFEDKRMNVLVSSAKEVILTIRMKEFVNELGVVEIIGKPKGQTKNEDASVSARGFDVEETKRYAGSLGDPARMASSYAGVSTNADGNNDIIVRGNSPRGVLWRIEGVEAPNPNHFSSEGASGGPISIINSNMLSNSDFYTSAFPAEFGNAYSGVFDINLRHGNSEQREYTAQLSVLGTELGAEGPFAKKSKASYNVNYRYSTLELIQNLGVNVAESALPKYQDATFKLRFPTAKMGVFNLYGVGGASSVSFSELDEDNNNRKYMKGTSYTKMGVLGLSHLLFAGDNTQFKTSLVYNGKTLRDKVDVLNRQDDFFRYQDESLNYQDLRLNLAVQHKLSAKHVVKGGVNYTQKFFGVDYKLQNVEENFQQTLIDQSGNTAVSQAFVNWKYRPTNKLTIIGGVHQIHFHLNGKNSVEPRIGATYTLKDKHILKAGIGVHSRLEPISTYYTQIQKDGNVVQPNVNLGFTKARHYVVGYETRITKNIRWSVEAYYQDLYDVPVENNDTSSLSLINISEGLINTAMVNQGTGENYGVEMTLERFFSNHYYFLVTASLFESKYTAMDGIKRDTRYNGNAVLNVLAGKEFDVSRNNKMKFFTLSTKGSFAGGNRYTAINIAASKAAGETVEDYENPYGVRASNYKRFDVQLSLRVNRKKTTREWKLDIQNVTNNINTIAQYYNPYTQKIVKGTQLGLLPVLSYKIEF